MNPKLLVLPSLCLGGAALLFAPVRTTQAFSKLGGSLGENQRDVRLYNTFVDTQANNNTTTASQYPGWLGAELAIWKAVAEWASGPYGDGTGDPVGGNVLGNGGGNFDAFWAGNANGTGNSNNNIVSPISSCGGGGTLAYCETPISDGWRIRFCEEWTWDDGPGGISGRFDIQGVMVHEYGHALGLGHSNVSGATMWPSIGAGSTSARSINNDDINGLQCIYGAKSGTKPEIVSTIADTGANTLTIYGSNFAASGIEVWFTNANVTSTGSDPIVRVVNVNSNGTELTVSIPANASPGNVMVNNPGSGHSTVSNAFPTDLEGTYGTPPFPSPVLTDVSPSPFDCLIPGTDQVITLTGTDMDLVTEVQLQGVPIDPSRWTIVNPTTITLDPPQAVSLGLLTITVTDGLLPTNQSVIVKVPAGPTLQWGTGDAGNVVSRGAGLDMILAGTPGQVHAVRGAPGPFSLATPGLRSVLIGSHALLQSGTYVIPSTGYLEVNLGPLPDPSTVGSTWFARSYDVTRPREESNLQSITLVP